MSSARRNYPIRISIRTRRPYGPLSPTQQELARKRAQLAPEISTAFKKFSQAVFADGALPAKTKQLIAVAVAHVTQCLYCIRGHTEAAFKHGASQQEVMEAIWVAAEMRAGAAYAHANLALETMNQSEAGQAAAEP
ncbi:MAG: carboxymuconolactone decarboxylase family protein [Burkholderiales bacterium]|nr:carboxymuconolactone decarboxylase family protein [Burkholderiales bacterium]